MALMVLLLALLHFHPAARTTSSSKPSDGPRHIHYQSPAWSSVARDELRDLALSCFSSSLSFPWLALLQPRWPLAPLPMCPPQGLCTYSSLRGLLMSFLTSFFLSGHLLCEASPLPAPGLFYCFL